MKYNGMSEASVAIRASKGGLRAFLSKYCAEHARTPYDFYGSYVRFP
jgi:hypothetical protein